MKSLRWSVLALLVLPMLASGVSHAVDVPQLRRTELVISGMT